MEKNPLSGYRIRIRPQRVHKAVFRWVGVHVSFDVFQQWRRRRRKHSTTRVAFSRILSAAVHAGRAPDKQVSYLPYGDKTTKKKKIYSFVNVVR